MDQTASQSNGPQAGETPLSQSDYFPEQHPLHASIAGPLFALSSNGCALSDFFRSACHEKAGPRLLATDLQRALTTYSTTRPCRPRKRGLDERVGERTRIARELYDTLLQGFQGLMVRQKCPEAEKDACWRD